MRVLLLGEFSALHKNLKEGLIELGHDAVVASAGDGWKKIDSDIDFSSKLPSFMGEVAARVKPYFMMDILSGYDVVQIINPFVFYVPGLPNKYLFDEIHRRNSKFFLLGAGDDSFFWKEGRGKLKYAPFDDFLKYDYRKPVYWMEGAKPRHFNEYVAERVNGVIPVMYEYWLGYENHKNVKEIIPIPINISKIKYMPNRPGDKLVVFHGLNRYGFKGTKYVEEAFAILAEKYPNELELIVQGHMPLDEYIKLMQRTNIVIDQANSHSCGVNAIIALAMGKVVLGGAERESLEAMGINTSPVVNIQPNSRSIVLEIERLIEQKHEIEKMGFESRCFAENVHDYKKVAQQYVDLWGRN